MKNRRSNLWLKRTLWVAAAIVGLAVASPRAQAGSATGYVCDTGLSPVSGGGGTGGYVWADVYSASGCTGSYLGTYIVTSAGNTMGGTVYSPAAQYAVYQNLVQAAMWNKQVYMSANAGDAVSAIYFYSKY